MPVTISDELTEEIQRLIKSYQKDSERTVAAIREMFEVIAKGPEIASKLLVLLEFQAIVRRLSKDLGIPEGWPNA